MKLARWYYGWNIVGLVVLSQMCAMGLPINCFSLFLPQWSREFHAPVSVFASAITIFSLACVPLGPFVGVCADRVTARRLFALGLGSLALFHLAIAYASSARQIAVFYALIAPLALLCSATIPAQAVVSRWFQKKRGLAMGLTAFGLAMAGVLFPPFVVLLIHRVGWRGTWLTVGLAIACISLPLIVLLLRDRPGAADSAAYLDAERTGPRPQRVAFRDILRRENFWYIGLAFLCLHGANLALTINLAPLVQSLGYTLGDAAALLSGLSISALVGKILCGVIADRFGSRPPLIAVGLLTALSLGLVCLTHSLPLLWLAFIALGLTQGVWTLVAAATATEFGAESFGQAYGLVVMFASVGSVAPPIFARLNEMAGHYVPGLLVFTAVAVAGTFSALLLNQRGVPAVNLAAAAGDPTPG